MEDIQYIISKGWSIKRGEYGKEGWNILDQVIFTKGDENRIIFSESDLNCFLRDLSNDQGTTCNSEE